jgi:hypothetical protein
MSTEATKSRSEIRLLDYAITLPVVGALGLVAGAIGAGIPVLEALPGMLILLVISFIGIVVTRYAPFRLPAVAWVTLVAMVVTLPWTPGSTWIVEQLENVDFLALATAVLAYAGLAIDRREVEMFKRSGWKFVVIAVFVFAGTFLGSAAVAELVLRIQGII